MPQGKTGTGLYARGHRAGAHSNSPRAGVHRTGAGGHRFGAHAHNISSGMHGSSACAHAAGAPAHTIGAGGNLTGARRHKVGLRPHKDRMIGARHWILLVLIRKRESSGNLNWNKLVGHGSTGRWPAVIGGPPNTGFSLFVSANGAEQDGGTAFSANRRKMAREPRALLPNQRHRSS